MNPREKLQHLGDSSMGGWHAKRDSSELQILIDTQLTKEIASLRHKSDAFGKERLLRGASHLFTVEVDLS